MKVMLVNGSPHEKGVINTALSEIAETLAKEGVESEIFWLGLHPIAGCIGCGVCRKTGHCFRNDIVNDFCTRVPEFDAFVFGSAVHYAAASGALCSFMDRVFYSEGKLFRGKPGAAVVSCRRAGSTAALDQINKYFFINNMPIPSSQYWNMLHGNTPEEAGEDLEGLQIMRTLARSMAWMLKCVETGKNAGIEFPEQEPFARTNFVR